MKQTLTKDMFRFQMNQIRPNNFSYEGQGFLFDYLEMFENDTATELEFDPIAICCDFSEMSIYDVIDAFNLDIDYERNVDIQVLDYLENNTHIVGLTTDNNVIFQNF